MWRFRERFIWKCAWTHDFCEYEVMRQSGLYLMRIFNDCVSIIPTLNYVGPSRRRRRHFNDNDGLGGLSPRNLNNEMGSRPHHLTIAK